MDAILREFLDRIGAHLDPMVAAFLARLIQFFEEKVRAMTTLYEEQTRRVGAEVRRVIHTESERLVVEGFKAISRGLWQLACANVIIAIVVGTLCIVALFFYGRYKWRQFFWERHMLLEARRQNTLTAEARDAAREQRDATMEQNKLLRALLKERGVNLDGDPSKPG